MLRRNITSLLLLMAIISMPPLAFPDDLRTWTSTNGVAISAQCVNANKTNVQLKLVNGAVSTVDRSMLSAEDNTYIENLLEQMVATQKAAQEKKREVTAAQHVSYFIENPKEAFLVATSYQGVDFLCDKYGHLVMKYSNLHYHTGCPIDPGTLVEGLRKANDWWTTSVQEHLIVPKKSALSHPITGTGYGCYINFSTSKGSNGQIQPQVTFTISGSQKAVDLTQSDIQELVQTLSEFPFPEIGKAMQEYRQKIDDKLK